MKQRLVDDLRTLADRVPLWLWPTRLRVIVLLVLAFAIWGWFDVRLRGTVDPQNSTIHKTDFTVYTEAGAAFFDGRDPYQVVNPRGWHYLYPPLFAMLVAPLHGLSGPAQVLVWFTLSVLMCWGCYRECVWIARAMLPAAPDRGAFGPIPTWIGYAAVTSALFPALNCLQRGQVGIAKVYLLLLGFRCLVESRRAASAALAGCVLALPVVLKITPLLPVAFMLVQQFVAALSAGDRRALWSRAWGCSLGTMCGMLLFVLLIPAALVGWQANLRHLDTWWHNVASRTDSSNDDFAGDSYSLRNQSLENAKLRLEHWIAYQFADGPDDDLSPADLEQAAMAQPRPSSGWPLWGIRMLAGCLLLAVGYHAGNDPLLQSAGFGLAGVATLVIAPIARAHYFVLLLPATMFVSLCLSRRDRPRLAVVYALLPGVLTIGHYAFIDITGRVGLLGIGTTLWYLSAACALLSCPWNIAMQQASPLAAEDEQGAPRDSSGSRAQGHGSASLAA